MKLFSQIARLIQVAKIFYRYGLDEYIESYSGFQIIQTILRIISGPRGDLNQDSRGVRLREALQELGPIFIKFGQIMSTRPDIFPDDIIQQLSLLQDQVPPFSGDEAQQIIEESLGESIDLVFRSFDITPLASASVAQVHAAELLNGDDVVIKVLRPGIEEEVARDIGLMYMLARQFMRIWPNAKRYRAVEIVQSYENTLRNGLDMMIEAANASRFRTCFENEERMYVPKVYWEYTTSRIMVMEKVEGIPIRDVHEITKAGIDLGTLAENGIGLFFEQAFHNGFFHGDLHPGNIFVSHEGQFRVVDFGIMGTLTDADRYYLAENLMAILKRDYRAVAELHLRAGWAPRDVSLEQFEIGIRTIMEPIFNQSVGMISFGKLLGRLFRTARQFGIQIQPQLLLFQKTFFNLEGLARSLYPDLDLWTAGRPYVEQWIQERYSVQSTLNKIRSEAPHWMSAVPELPQLAHEVLSNIRDNQAKGSGGRGLSQRIIATYRSSFFALMGIGASIITVLNWSSNGFGFWVLITTLAAIGFLAAAWPRGDVHD